MDFISKLAQITLYMHSQTLIGQGARMIDIQLVVFVSFLIIILFLGVSKNKVLLSAQALRSNTKPWLIPLQKFFDSNLYSKNYMSFFQNPPT